MHCSAEELEKMERIFFTREQLKFLKRFLQTHIPILVIAGKRSYNYVIFNTRPILGVDLKFIVRINKDDSL